MKIRTLSARCCLCGSGAHSTVGRGKDFEYHSCDNEFRFVRCDGCGHHYLFPFPDPEELSTIYPPSYGNYGNSVNPGLAFKIKSLLEKWALRKIVHWLSPGSAVLDIGCGDGRLLDNLRKVCPEGTILQGIEISEVAAQEARRKGYQVTVASIDQLHPGPERYDLICLIQVIEHVFDPVGCLKKVYSMLRPGGLLLIETPSTKCLDFTLFHSRYWGGYHFPRHLNLFDPVGLSKLLTNQKFEILSISHKLQPVHWVWTCHHYFQDRGYPDWWSEWFHIKSPIPLAVFTLVDAAQLLLSGRSSNMRVLAQR